MPKVIMPEPGERMEDAVLCDRESITEDQLNRVKLPFERDIIAAFVSLPKEAAGFNLVLCVPLKEVAEDTVTHPPYSGTGTSVTAGSLIVANAVSVWLVRTRRNPIDAPDAEPNRYYDHLLTTAFGDIFRFYQAEGIANVDEPMRLYEIRRLMLHALNESVKRFVGEMDRKAADLRAEIDQIAASRCEVLQFMNPFNH